MEKKQSDEHTHDASLSLPGHPVTKEDLQREIKKAMEQSAAGLGTPHDELEKKLGASVL